MRTSERIYYVLAIYAYTCTVAFVGMEHTCGEIHGAKERKFHLVRFYDRKSCIVISNRFAREIVSGSPIHWLFSPIACNSPRADFFLASKTFHDVWPDRRARGTVLFYGTINARFYCWLAECVDALS